MWGRQREREGSRGQSGDAAATTQRIDNGLPSRRGRRRAAARWRDDGAPRSVAGPDAASRDGNSSPSNCRQGESSAHTWGFDARPRAPSRLAGLRLLVSDCLEHEAVQVQEECCVEALVVLGKELGLVEYLVAVILRPLVNPAYVDSRWNVERNMLQSNLVPRVATVLERRIEEDLRPLPIDRAVSNFPLANEPDQRHELVVVGLRDLDVGNAQANVIDPHPRDGTRALTSGTWTLSLLVSELRQGDRVVRLTRIVECGPVGLPVAAGLTFVDDHPALGRAEP